MSDPVSRAESLAERRIREALDAGEFDDLPGQGRPIPDDGRPYEPGWWARRYLERLRQDDARRERVRDLTNALDRCWTLERDAAMRRFAQIGQEWAELCAADDSLPEPPTAEAFRSAWEQMRRTR